MSIERKHKNIEPTVLEHLAVHSGKRLQAANKVSAKNWRFEEIFSCAKLHFVFAESGRDMLVGGSRLKGDKQRKYTQFARLKDLF